MLNDFNESLYSRSSFTTARPSCVSLAAVRSAFEYSDLEARDNIAAILGFFVLSAVSFSINLS